MNMSKSIIQVREDLYDRYVAAGTTYAEIVALPMQVSAQQIAELRGPGDDPELTDMEIATAIYDLAASKL
jgi:hypothetical protein